MDLSLTSSVYYFADNHMAHYSKYWILQLKVHMLKIGLGATSYPHQSLRLANILIPQIARICPR